MVQKFSFYFLSKIMVNYSKNYHFNTGISPLNKIWKYMSFTKKDKVLSDFIDYMSFYTSWNFAPLTKLLSSDNAPSVYLGRLSIDCLEKKIWLFRAWISTSYLWYSIKLCQLQEMKIWNKIVLKVDLYWKWLKLLREDEDLRKSFRIFCSDWLLLWEELTITRIDYTVDCMKLNFRKENSLRCRCSWMFSKDWEVKTKYFGVKWHDSAMFIRYYDKKEEIAIRWTDMLYPEYRFLPVVMRYELQVNSKWFDKYERTIKFDDLYSVICMWYKLKDRWWNHHKVKDESIYKDIVILIDELKRSKDYESLDKVWIYLDWIYRKWGLACPVLCETLVQWKRSHSN